MRTVSLLGFKISNRGLKEDIVDILKIIDNRSYGHYLACANPHSICTAKKDNIFHKSLLNADILLPDGIGIIIGARILGLDIIEKVAGLDLFLSLSFELNQKEGVKYFFLGSTNNVLSKIKERIAKDYANIRVCGTYSPPFKPSFNEQDTHHMISSINNAKPDVLWVGMTAPKQEKWIYENQNKIEVPFIGAIGAAFDFYAGTKKRSSGIWIKLGLEWLPRFIREPRRLLKRNLISSPLYLYWVVKEKIRLVIRKTN